MNPLFERVILGLLGLVVFWQIILPLVRERPLFPLFRRKWDPDQRMKAARGRHDVALAALDLAKLEAETTRIKLEATKVEAATAASIDGKQKESEK